ncbi:transmembrane protein 190 isoform X6 [Monodelphis domestica]|uniref:transmembrane protein 190 isoform X6 n=1 Tax=Monodelphis domestica TaxID=13616 RepID=UPI0024E1E616|nr:transmembrane protein 190 isoform X6 [Monodelphis domestica]
MLASLSHQPGFGLASGDFPAAPALKELPSSQETPSGSLRRMQQQGGTWSLWLPSSRGLLWPQFPHLVAAAQEGPAQPLGRWRLLCWEAALSEPRREPEVPRGVESKSSSTHGAAKGKCGTGKPVGARRPSRTPPCVFSCTAAIRKGSATTRGWTKKEQSPLLARGSPRQAYDDADDATVTSEDTEDTSEDQEEEERRREEEEEEEEED